MMEIDPRHLRILLSIAEHGSFTRAAAARRMSPPDIAQEVLLELAFDAVVNARHALAKRSVISLPELTDVQWALPTLGGAFRRHLEGLFVTAGVPFPSSYWACDSLMALKSLVMHADCVSILPRHAIALDTRVVALQQDPAARRRIEAEDRNHDIADARALTVGRSLPRGPASGSDRHWLMRFLSC